MIARAGEARVAMLALVSNSEDQVVADFDTGENDYRIAVLSAIARAAPVFIPSPVELIRDPTSRRDR